MIHNAVYCYQWPVICLRLCDQMLECMYVRQAIDLLEGLLLNPNGENKEVSAAHLEKLVIFAMMWSLGALLELNDKKKVLIALPSSFYLKHCGSDVW